MMLLDCDGASGPDVLKMPGLPGTLEPWKTSSQAGGVEFQAVRYDVVTLAASRPMGTEYLHTSLATSGKAASND
jgi:hypothetical protein